MRLGIDLDGVVVDWVGSVCRELGIPSRPEEMEWDSIFQVSNMTNTELFAFCKEAGVFYKADPVEGAVEGLEALFAAGHDVQFVTSRPEWSREETVDWLDDAVDIPTAEIREKLHIVQGTNKSVVPCDLYLDDSPHVLTDLRRRKKWAVRFEQPWNKSCRKYSQTVSGWPAFLNLVGSL